MEAGFILDRETALGRGENGGSQGDIGFGKAKGALELTEIERLTVERQLEWTMQESEAGSLENAEVIE